MITQEQYLAYLSSKGEHISEVRKNQADMIMNASFTNDIAYRKVCILTKDEGWKYTDAKFSRHTVRSLSGDEADSYLQFRPKEHYPLGSFVLIPDDTSYQVTIDNDPLGPNANNLWVIVTRNNDRQFVHYLVLKCNWYLKWATGFDDNKKINYCWGCCRDANSYTSGIWRDLRVDALDNIYKFIIPNTYHVYGDHIQEYGLGDTRTIYLQKRLMISLNDLHPSCFMVSKHETTSLPGLIKLTMKQDDYNHTTDSIELGVCDYFTKSGDVSVKQDAHEQDVEKVSTIRHMVVNEDGELQEDEDASTIQYRIGELHYFDAVFSDQDISAWWRINLLGDYIDEERVAIEKLITIRQIADTSISLKFGKSSKLKGKTFRLTVNDVNGDYQSYIDLEVL